MVQQTERKEIGRLAVYYYAYRKGGKRAVDAYREARELMGQTDKWSDSSAVAGNLITNLLPLAIAVGIVVATLNSFRGYIEGGLWITSRTGKTTVQLPFKLAMRVVRKRKWRLAKVEPVKPRRSVQRVEAFKILCYGDKEV